MAADRRHPVLSSGQPWRGLAVNRWNKFFFDALEQKDTRTVILGLGYILILAALSAAFSVGLLQSRMRLQVRWRQWLAGTLIARWLADRHFYQLAIVHTEADNPERASPRTPGFRSSFWSICRSAFLTPCSPRCRSSASSGSSAAP
jgi:hypothetical protein